MCSQCTAWPAAQPPPSAVFLNATPLGAEASATMAAVDRLPSSNAASCADSKYSMPQSVLCSWWVGVGWLGRRRRGAGGGGGKGGDWGEAEPTHWCTTNHSFVPSSLWEITKERICACGSLGGAREGRLGQFFCGVCARAGAHGVVRGAAAGVADHVRVALLDPKGRRRVNSGIHAHCLRELRVGVKNKRARAAAPSGR